LTVHATATESIFVIDNVSFDATSNGDHETAQSEFESRRKYNGPPWQQLDEELQLLMERYLEERGINTALALFIPDYAELKEQKEYLSWLKNLKSFVDK
jgi:complement component 1 Q subcomponent-binding protein, mitochondrial